MSTQHSSLLMFEDHRKKSLSPISLITCAYLILRNVMVRSNSLRELEPDELNNFFIFDSEDCNCEIKQFERS